MIKNFVEKINSATERLGGDIERAMGKCLDQPFSNANSGPRKLMYAIHHEHCCNLSKPETAIITTGFENRWGDLSSSIIQSDDEFEVLAKIAKFSSLPDHHYFLLILKDNKILDFVERKVCEHTAESHGYLYDTDIQNQLKIGQKYPAGTFLQRSNAYDEYANRCDGINLQCLYLTCEGTTEDSYNISEETSIRGGMPLVDVVPVMLNDNDIPLLVYQNGNGYKSFPDINEDVEGGMLLVARTEKEKEMLFMQSSERLSQVMMSDEKYIINGKVVDIDVYCNNPENLTKNRCYDQIKKYHDNSLRFIKEFLDAVNKFSYGKTLSYNLEKLVCKFEMILNGKLFIKEKPFSNVLLEITVYENIPLDIGDKMSNRHGGKGVISMVIPNELMPKLDNGRRIDVIINKSTCTNRENLGQLIENELTCIGEQIIEWIRTNHFRGEEAISYVLRYLDMISPKQSEFIRSQIYRYKNESDRNFVIDQFLEDIYDIDDIFVSSKPISESMDLDGLDAIYKAFPFVDQRYMIVPIIDSNGNVRYIRSIRKAVCGKQYHYRLKQYSKEKFSVTSLSAVNLRNENARSKASKNYKLLNQNTPIRFGEMESNDMNHLGTEVVVTNLMILSLSPHARRLVKSALVSDDPFNVDIRLNKYSRNRSVEKLNVYFKTIGLRLRFIKKRQELKPGFLKPGFVELKPGFLKPGFLEVDEETK